MFDFFIPYFWSVLIALIIIYAINRKIAKKNSVVGKIIPEIYSRENIVSQLFIILTVIFFGLTLGTFNKFIGTPLTLLAVICITLIISTIVTYYSKILSLGISSLIVWCVWWGAQASDWIEKVGIRESVAVTGFMIIALLFYTLGHTHKKNEILKKISTVYFTFGSIILTCLLLVISSKKGMRLLAEMMQGEALFKSWQLTICLSIGLVLLLGALIVALRKDSISKGETLATLFMTVIAMSILFISGSKMYISYSSGLQSSNILSPFGVVIAILINLALFIEALGLLFFGYLRQETTWINLGVFALFFLIFIKYINWFYNAFDKSIFFIGAGILLLVTGWLMEKGRRYMLTQIKDSKPST